MPDDKTPCCECGYEVTATDEAGRVDEIRSHAQEAHGIVFSIEEALLVLLRSELDLSQAPSISGTRKRRVSQGGAQ